MTQDNKDLPIFEGFDHLGQLTGHKCMICLYLDKKCKHQGFYGEGTFMICKKFNENEVESFKCEIS